MDGGVWRLENDYGIYQKDSNFMYSDMLHNDSLWREVLCDGTE